MDVCKCPIRGEPGLSSGWIGFMNKEAKERQGSSKSGGLPLWFCGWTLGRPQVGVTDEQPLFGRASHEPASKNGGGLSYCILGENCYFLFKRFTDVFFDSKCFLTATPKRRPKEVFNMKSQRLIQVMIGIGRLLDFSGSYNSELNRKYLKTKSSELDRNALMKDWMRVGNSLRSAMDKNKLSDDQIRHNHV